MKNRFIYFAPIFSACAFCLDLNAASIVSQSGDWSGQYQRLWNRLIF